MLSPIKAHGGKHYLAQRIVDLMPKHRHYVEPYIYSGAVLFAKPQPACVSEVGNDINGTVVNFFRCLSEQQTREWLVEKLSLTPFSEECFRNAKTILANTYTDRLNRAWAFFVVNRQSFSAHGMNLAPTSKTRTRRGINEQVATWLSGVELLAPAAARLRTVYWYNTDACRVILREDSEDTLYYLDPPYHPDTRVTKDAYEFEMSAEQHEQLLKVVNHVEGKVILSGYRCPAYDIMLSKWRRIDMDMPNHASGEATKRRMVESLWLNW